jgi:hypothetical protein
LAPLQCPLAVQPVAFEAVQLSSTDWPALTDGAFAEMLTTGGVAGLGDPPELSSPPPPHEATNCTSSKPPSNRRRQGCCPGLTNRVGRFKGRP